jgi:hypothetical protein
MIALAALLLLAAPPGNQVIEEIHQIPAGDWKYREITIARPGRITASYQVLNGSGRVRAALMLREDLERMDSDLTASILATPEGRRGFFADRVRRVGDYVVVIDNQDGRRAATVALRVELDFAGRGGDVGRLSPQRQIAVVAVSCVVFLGIVGFSAQRLLKAMHGPPA